ncbi:hypothetical protein HYH03_005961 [Edaphochlamys debaryana]|uniref:Amine oxidase domain-containing protein n=1 Tax=Edaphochlamys debaryana TaxID=47281 RepID=A0A835YBW6_9CHLO|nr:hypothetical protein HYH03_005961 [Edaphochlamys debaryana]|eukprot:KAG2496040.1 hypothetical protein HYH03_005961 [Edaphochlamys debaryana]
MGKQMPGGRTSTRFTSAGQQYDHGCQFFRASSGPFKRLVREWLQAGVIAEWKPRLGVYDATTGSFKKREDLGPAEAAAAGSGFFDALSPTAGPMFVGQPSMETVVAHVLEQCPAAGAGPGLELGEGWEAEGGNTLRLNTRVHKARWSEGKWHLAGERVQLDSNGGIDPCLPSGEAWNLGVFDALVLADSQVAKPGSHGHITFETPPASLRELQRQLTGLSRVPLFSLLVGWPPNAAGALLPGDAVQVVGGQAVQWVANDTSKPGRKRTDGMTCWVAVTRPDFAARLVGASPGKALAGLPQAGPEYNAKKAQEIWTAMQSDLRAAMGIRPLNRPKYLSAHRWGSAYVTNPLGQPAVSDVDSRWAACGDFCLGAGVESAAISGASAADAVANMLGLPPATPAAGAAAGLGMQGSKGGKEGGKDGLAHSHSTGEAGLRAGLGGRLTASGPSMHRR